MSSGSEEECPVCFKALSHTEPRPFACGHGLCEVCDVGMRNAGDHRCPICRHPRIGMTVAEAAPPPEGSFGSVELPLFLLQQISTQVQNYRRSDAGHTLFFAMEEPTSLNDEVDEITRALRTTVESITDLSENELVNALTHLTDVPSISEWNRLRSLLA